LTFFPALRAGFGRFVGRVPLSYFFQKEFTMTTVKPPLFGGKTIEEWDLDWKAVEDGLRHYQPQLRRSFGLYRISWGRQIMAMGTGTDKDGGLAKRLSDFRRPSWSASNHYAGRLIRAHRCDLTVEVLIIGSDQRAREIAQQLKTPMIRRHKPVWTGSSAPYMHKG